MIEVVSLPNIYQDEQSRVIQALTHLDFWNVSTLSGRQDYASSALAVFQYLTRIYADDPEVREQIDHIIEALNMWHEYRAPAPKRRSK